MAEEISITKRADNSRERFDRLLEDLDYLFHELRTPLTALISYSEFLRDHDLPAKRQHPLLEIMRLESLRIDSLLEAFSKVYRRGNGTWLTDVNFSEIDLEVLLHVLTVQFQNVHSKHSIKLVLPSNLPTIRGDWDKLYLVFRNLIANAVKYSPEGGEICISGGQNHHGVFIQVKDEGIGIPTDLVQKIFCRGVRLNVDHLQKVRGSGFGLTLVKLIVESHHGTILVENPEEKGTCFTISLPGFQR